MMIDPQNLFGAPTAAVPQVVSQQPIMPTAAATAVPSMPSYGVGHHPLLGGLDINGLLARLSMARQAFPDRFAQFMQSPMGQQLAGVAGGGSQLAPQAPPQQPAMPMLPARPVGTGPAMPNWVHQYTPPAAPAPTQPMAPAPGVGASAVPYNSARPAGAPGFGL